MRRSAWFHAVSTWCVAYKIFIDSCLGMTIRWDHFVGQYDTARFVSGGDARDNRHVQFVREFASVVSVLQVNPHLNP